MPLPSRCISRCFGIKISRTGGRQRIRWFCSEASSRLAPSRASVRRRAACSACRQARIWVQYGIATAITVSASGPSVGLTWMRARSSAVKWIRHTMTVSLTRHPVTNQRPAAVPFIRPGPPEAERPA